MTDPLSSEEVVLFSHIEITMLNFLLEEKVAEEEEEEEISKEGGADKLKLKNPIFITYAAIKTGMMHLHVSCLGIKLSSK